MPITPAEREKYIVFIQQQVRELKCLDVSPETIIWHYTTGNGLLGIIESGTLYASQVACLNDSSEIRYGGWLYRQALVDLLAQEQLSPEESDFIDGQIKRNTEALVSRPNVSDSFVTCFSTERDDLSQWRAYGGGENGYAIGFMAGFLFRPDSLLTRVNYDRELHLLMAKRSAEATLTFFREGLVARKGEERLVWGQEFQEAWGPLLARLAPMVKDQGFKSENEVRIIRQFQVDEKGRLTFRQRQSVMAMYLELEYSLPTPSDPKLMPITEIIVGPSRHKDVSALTVAVLLNKMGYTQVPVYQSVIPYQTT